MRIGMGAAQHSYLSPPLLRPPPLSPPPPPPPSKSNNMPMLYYGVLVVGTAAIVLAIYNLLIIRWCADSYRPQTQQRQGTTPTRRLEQRGAASSQGFDNPNLNLISNTFKYKRGGGGGAKDQANDCECAVCLSVFEEGEEVRQLPRCKHLFHAPCIDMWLHSHLDCPLCRSRVEPPALCRSPLAPPIPNRYASTPGQARGVSADALLEPTMFAL